MKRRLIVVFLICSLVLFCACGSKEADSRKSERDSVNEQNSSEKNSKGKDTEEDAENKKEVLYLLSKDHYDENGNLFYSNKTEYVKNSQGRIFLSREYNEGDPSNGLDAYAYDRSEDYFEYDDDFKHMMHYDKNHELSYENFYNESYKCIKTINYRSGRVESMTQYEFDDEGREIKRIECNEDGIPVSTMYQEYENDKLKRQKIERNGQESIAMYSYVHEGNILKKECIISANGQERTRIETEEYDDYGNIIAKTTAQGEVSRYKYTYMDDGSYTKQRLSDYPEEYISVSLYNAAGRIMEEKIYKGDEVVLTVKYVYGIPE